MTIALRTPAIRRAPRLHGRRTYAGQLAGGVLRVDRGAWEVEIDHAGDEIGRRYDPRRSMHANIGDQLIVSSRDVSDWAVVCVLEVVAIVRDTWTTYAATVRRRCGRELGGGVWIMAGRRAAAQR